MIKIYAFVLIILLPLFSAGCQSDSLRSEQSEEATFSAMTTTPESKSPIRKTPINLIPTLEPYVFGVSDAGYATVHGYIFVTNINIVQPDPNDAVFLVPYSENLNNIFPSIIVGEHPQAEVDERSGEFMATNIVPGTYAVIVLMKSGAQMPALSFDTGEIVIVDVTEHDIDHTIELDYIRVP